jgi:hypothetical protein
MATPAPGFEPAIGERTSYHGLEILVFKERGAYRVVLADGPDAISSTCAGYSADGIRERAAELAYGYLMKRDGSAPKPDGPIAWSPISY